MRIAACLALVLVAAACSEEPSAPLPDENAQQIARLRADLDAMRVSADVAARTAAEVADLRRVLAELRAELDAVRTVTPVKVPHLVVRETGEDLGPWLGGLESYSPKYNAPVRWDHTGEAIFPTSDCTGDEVILRNSDWARLIPGTVIFDVNGGAMVFYGRRPVEMRMYFILRSGVCEEAGVLDKTRPVVRLLRDGAVPPDSQLLSVEPR